MKPASYQDISRLFPSVQDHTIVELLNHKPTLDDIEAVALLLANQDDDLIEAKHKQSLQLSNLLMLLSRDETVQEEDHDR